MSDRDEAMSEYSHLRSMGSMEPQHGPSSGTLPDNQSQSEHQNQNDPPNGFQMDGGDIEVESNQNLNGGPFQRTPPHSEPIDRAEDDGTHSRVPADDHIPAHSQRPR